MTHVVVIGAGAAGTAAAWAASPGARVTVVDGGAGATSFSSGAIDVAPWAEIDRLARDDAFAPSLVNVGEPARSFVEALGAWELTRGEPAWVATMAGRVRPAAGCDRALLNLATLRGHTVFVPRAERAHWDADALAAAWSEDVPQFLGIRFRAIDAPVLRFDDERRIADGDLAFRHDEQPRLRWLAERLRSALSKETRPAAVILGPWLGADESRREALSKLVGFPVGESLSGHAGTSGLRFEAARDRLLAGRVQLVRGRVASVEPDSAEIVVSFTDERASLRADAVVLAIGGLVGGGLRFEPPSLGAGTEGANQGRAPFELSLSIPSEITAANFPIVGSMYGPYLDETAWPSGDREGSLELVGLKHEHGAIASRLFVAGDIRRGAARTIFEAVESGVSAGRSAAGESLSAASPRVAGIPQRA